MPKTPKCVWSKFFCERREPQFPNSVENQLEIEFLFGKARKFDINLQNIKLIIYFHFTQLSHTKVKDFVLQVETYYKVYKEINYSDTNTFSKNNISKSSQLGTVQRIKFYHAVNALKLRIYCSEVNP